MLVPSLLGNLAAVIFALAYASSLPLEFWFRAPAIACCLLGIVVISSALYTAFFKE